MELDTISAYRGVVAAKIPEPYSVQGLDLINLPNQASN